MFPETWILIVWLVGAPAVTVEFYDESLCNLAAAKIERATVDRIQSVSACVQTTR